MNKQQLANKIWESANKMRSKIEANEYKDYILGFIFYKYLSDQEEKFLKENDFTEDDMEYLTEENEDTASYIKENIGYFISYENLFSTWLRKGSDFDVSNVTDALSAFSRNINPSHKRVYDKIFQTLETGLSKLGDSSGARTKSISGLLQLIKDIPMDGKQDYDVLGFIYEYLISMFAANAGKKAGEFYTPHEVPILMSEIVAHHLQGRENIKIYDPTSGSGSLLINIGKSVSKYMDSKDKIQYYAQELKENTYNLTRMNLVMRGIRPDNIFTRNGDTLEQDWPYFEEEDFGTYERLRVDAVVSNPPYSQAWDPTNKENDPRYARFGLAPKGKADYAFLLHDLYHVVPDGIMTIVLPHGVLFRGGEEGEIRKNLIENNHIDAIIGLPANIFFGTGIPTIIMVLKQKRENTDVLIVDASKGYVKEGKNNKLRSSDIKRIADAVINRADVDKFSRKVSREEIRNNEYNLNIPRYVDSSEKAESWDIYASMFGGIPASEIEDLKEYWEAFPELKESLFTKSDIPFADIAVDDIKKAIKEHTNVVDFENIYAKAYEGFEEYLKSMLLDGMMAINVTKGEADISEEIFNRMAGIPLIDKYEAYQILDNEWKKIAVDLEIVQTEGFEATKKVDPNMVLKKKDGKEIEVQEGWIGHVIPFALVQSTILKEEAETLKAMENRLAEIPSQYEELIESLTEEEKEQSILNDEKDSFVAKEVTAKLKELKKDNSPEAIELKNKLVRYEDIAREEKTLKAEIKSGAALLIEKTKETIEKLADEEVYALLKEKWITSMVEQLYLLPDKIVDELVKKIQSLGDKYSTTYFEIEEEISSTEKALSEMIDQLVGSEFDMKGLSEFKKLLMGE